MVDGIFVFLKQYLIFGRGSGTIYQKINLSTGWASYFCVTPLFETFWSGSLNWARFPLLSYSSPLLSPFLSSPLNWALFWAKLLNWALFWANPLVWALFWALKRVNLLSRALFWVVLLFWALKKELKLSQNLYENLATWRIGRINSSIFRWKQNLELNSEYQFLKIWEMCHHLLTIS